MTVTREERVSDSPFVESIWQVQALNDGSDIVSADAGWDIIITRQNEETRLMVWGPTTKAAVVPYLEGSQSLGIRFKLGTFLTSLPTYSRPDSGAQLPGATRKSFWLNSSTWEFPNYENVETFVNRLARAGVLSRDALVEAALQGDPQLLSLRSIQRRFLGITGLTQRHIHSIERARQAAALLASGTSILDTVWRTGYADQQSMTKSLKRFLGQTPSQIARSYNSE